MGLARLRVWERNLLDEEIGRRHIRLTAHAFITGAGDAESANVRYGRLLQPLA